MKQTSVLSERVLHGRCFMVLFFFEIHYFESLNTVLSVSHATHSCSLYSDRLIHTLKPIYSESYQSWICMQFKSTHDFYARLYFGFLVPRCMSNKHDSYSINVCVFGTILTRNWAIRWWEDTFQLHSFWNEKF